MTEIQYNEDRHFFRFKGCSAHPYRHHKNCYSWIVIVNKGNDIRELISVAAPNAQEASRQAVLRLPTHIAERKMVSRLIFTHGRGTYSKAWKKEVIPSKPGKKEKPAKEKQSGLKAKGKSNLVGVRGRKGLSGHDGKSPDLKCNIHDYECDGVPVPPALALPKGKSSKKKGSTSGVRKKSTSETLEVDSA